MQMDLTLHPSDWCDHQMGRRPSETPAHLPRVLYVPRHENGTTHLPIYEGGNYYQDAVQDTLMGSTLYSQKLSFMKRPFGCHMDEQVEYLADLHYMEPGTLQLQLNKRDLKNRDLETHLWACTVSFFI